MGHQAGIAGRGTGLATVGHLWGVCAAPDRVGYRGEVRLPFDPPIEPMLAKPADALPEGDGWLFEPKWDGFRAVVFRDGAETLIQSRDLKPLDRYFPELDAPLR